ncbi:MAG: ferritin family protein [Sedimentisphaerales bacterium]|nr:ferritin family protein [Sedimentisphaerales bacterium]
MSVEFNAFEAFQIAERIEHNGAVFYRRSSELFDNPRICKLFLQLADWEKGHEEVFANMRKQLSGEAPGQRIFKPEDVPFDPKAMAGLAVFGKRAEPSDELSGKESVIDILKMAVEKEKDSIVYYTGLKGFVSAQAGKDKIDDIIKEEYRHIGILSQSLQQRE